MCGLFQFYNFNNSYIYNHNIDLGIASISHSKRTFSSSFQDCRDNDKSVDLAKKRVDFTMGILS